MPKPLYSVLLLASFLPLPLAAHAGAVDDFVLTGGGHTISYSLPATSSFPDFDLFNFFSETASTTTIDGVSGYDVAGDYYVGYSFAPTFVLYVPDATFGTSMLDLFGPEFYTIASVPASNPSPYLPYDVVPTFSPGTYALQNYPNYGNPFIPPPPIPYTLTITQETATATTPEPPSLALLVTGVLAFIGFTSFKSRRPGLSY